MDKDASKFMSSDITVPQIYTSFEGVSYAINERPVSDGTVSLSAFIGKEGFYTIALDNDVEDCLVILEDKAEQKSVVLTKANGYTFSAKPGTIDNRFVLHFNNGATSIADIHSDKVNDAPIYSIEGIKMNAPTKNGIYIQNGKKILLNK